MTLKKSELLTLTLRERYEQCGYRPFRMSKFEEYDFYVRNKEALTHEGVITFTDIGGKLMALKPDVTLSIIKQAEDTDTVQKVYYNENVYRVAQNEGCYKEIPQMGLECMGDIDPACIYEVVRLAMDSLQAIGHNAILDLSHLGLLEELLTDVPNALREQICSLLAQKNAHELRALCNRANLSQELCHVLCELTGLYGAPQHVLPRLKELLPHSAALAELEALTDLFAGETGLHIDPSVMDDMNYYNGFVFKGFVRGVPEQVLSGGRYDKLMRQMGHKGGSIGFALYPARLERLEQRETAPDADILLLYRSTDDIAALQQVAGELRREGSVMLQKRIPDELRFGKILRFENGRAVENE